MNLNLSLRMLSNNKVVSWAVGGMLLSSFLGFLDAAYLTAEHYLGIPLVCVVFNGCEDVLKSEYALLFGIPIALFGALYYASVFILSLLFVDTKNPLFLKGALALPMVGILVSGFLVYVQGFILGKWCQYCLLSALLTLVLFICSVVIISQLRKQS